MRNFVFLAAILFSFKGFSQNVTVLYNDKEYEFSKDYKLVVKEKYRIKIHNKQGYYFSVFRDYYDDFKRIRDVDLTIYDQNGNKIKKIGKGDALDISLSGSNEITDTRLLVIDHKYSNYPFEVEVEVDYVQNGFIGFSPWLPRPYFEVEVKESSLKIESELADSMNIKYYTEFDSLMEYSSLTEKGKIKHLWRATDLDAVPKLAEYKTFYENQPKVVFTTDKFSYDGIVGDMSTWSDFGRWFWELNKDRGGLMEETMSFLYSVEYENTKDLVKQIYQYMQDRTRYISIQLGIGGFQSIPSYRVDEIGYGDCKALTTYMKEMLIFKGIESNYVLVKAGRDVPDVVKEFPSNQFNHVFLAIPQEEDTIYLECTSQTLPFNYLSSFTDDRNVLWVEEGNSKIIRTPVYDESINVKTNSGIIKLDDTGSGILELTTEKSGVFYDEYDYLESMNEDMKRQYIVENLQFNDFGLLDYEYERKNKDFPKYESSFTIQLNSVGRKVGDGKIVLESNLLDPVERNISFSRMNKFAEIKRSFKQVDDVEVILDGIDAGITLPEPFKIDNGYGSYLIEYSRTESGYRVHREFVFNKGRYDESDFRRFYSYLRKLQSADKKSIVVDSRT